MKILLYGNGGSGNHGCEAIVRGTISLLGSMDNSFIIHSDAVEEDCKYGLKEFADIKPAKSEIKKDWHFLYAFLRMKVFHDFTSLDGLYYLNSIKKAADKADIALSVGGDNYCYGDTGIYAYLNKAYKKVGLKTALWGCSVEPEVVAEQKVAEDLKKYHLVVARESITYEAIKAVHPNTILAPDPAFFMQPQACVIDERFQSNDVIGINISPMIVSNESVSGMAYENYKSLIMYILENTNSYIALIPHVVWKRNDDRNVLKQLYKEFQCSERLIMVNDYTAPELKFVISKCRMFVGARTHATIAAYSSCVPTLVVGYSVKARGIARDLFGAEEGYVLPVQSLQTTNDLTYAFKWLSSHEMEVKEHLKNTLPGYVANGIKAAEALRKI